MNSSGDDLLSQAVTHQVSSAQRSLTTVFGMGTGVTFSLLPPNIVETKCVLLRFLLTQQKLPLTSLFHSFVEISTRFPLPLDLCRYTSHRSFAQCSQPQTLSSTCFIQKPFGFQIIFCCFQIKWRKVNNLLTRQNKLRLLRFCSLHKSYVFSVVLPLPKKFRLKSALFGNPYLLVQVKPSTYQYRSAEHVTMLTPPTYQPHSLRGVLLAYAMGNLILGGASRLDAFSVYPFRTQLPSYAFGKTTGAPVVRPSRSSRTKDSSLQISCARDGQGPNCLTTF